MLAVMPPAPKPPSAADMIKLIIEQAPALIDVGVTELAIDGFAVKLARPARPPADMPAPKGAPIAKQHVDPMSDPSTYPGGRVPGYTREDVPR